LLPTDIGFTGQRRDATGLMYFRARYYAQSIGRFVSADTLVPSANDPQQLNRFSYGLNNPVKYRDSSGHCIDGITTIPCLIALIAATGFFGGAAIHEFNVSGRSWWESGEDAKATFSAGVEGAATSVTVAGVVADAAVAATAIVADYAIKTNNIQLFQWGASGGRLPPVQAATGDSAETGLTTTPSDLYAFGGKTTGPRLPRVGTDVFPNSSGMLEPQGPPFPQGASTFGDVEKAPLTGHYYKLPGGTQLPPGLAVHADGSDIYPSSILAPTHHTIYNSVEMTVEKLLEMFKNLPWTYGGKK
jgi:RHS repeat-associated protein